MSRPRPGVLDDRRRTRAAAELDLLRHALDERGPAFARRVFTNRTLRMEKIRHVGFDLDWTLANYDQDELSRLAFGMALERLVENFDYPRVVLEAEYQPHFARRGLMLDTKAGTVVKMNRHRYVGRAYRGRTFLDAGERGELYRREPINPSSDRFYFVDTLFELPEANLFSELIEISEKRPEALQLDSYKKLAADLRQAVDDLHADGTLKRRILDDLERYLPRDPELDVALDRMALGGRRLMLITNSEWYYTEALCRYLFDGSGGNHWSDLFDLVIVAAGKPGFFRKKQPFTALDRQGNEESRVDVPSWGGIYAGGSRAGLMQLLQSPGEEVLYVGDHIYGDVLSSKLASTWRTALVVSELEHELTTLRNLASQARHLQLLRAELAEIGQRMDDAEDILGLHRAVRSNGDAHRVAEEAIVETREALEEYKAEHRAMRHHAARLQKRLSEALNPYWGSIFKQGSNKSLFGSQVDDFACIYTSRVSNFAFYGSKHYYRAVSDPMMHEAEL